VALAAAGFPLALLPALGWPRLWGPWAVTLLLLAAAFALDALLAVAPRRLGVTVETPALLGVGERGEARVTVEAPRPTGPVTVLLDVDRELEPPAPARLEARPGAPGTARLPLVARRRGQLAVETAWLRWTGPLGLCARQRREPLGRTVSVVPALAAVRAAALRFHAGRTSAAGVQVERYVGDGSEFDALREHVPGLDPRAIHWKASAKHRKLLVQDFRAERNHQVVLAFDTGHLMAEPLAGLPRLDHAVNAGLLLAHVSLRLGDRVGLFGFDAAARAWTAPAGGIGAFARLRAATAALSYTTAETNFTLGLTELSTRLRRRSLVVVFTEFVDTVSAELMLENLARLARRQLVLFVALRDPGLEATRLVRPARLADVHRAAIASELAKEREGVLARLRRMGVLCVDAGPDGISTRLLNRYLDVKRRELIA